LQKKLTEISYPFTGGDIDNAEQRIFSDECSDLPENISVRGREYYRLNFQDSYVDIIGSIQLSSHF